MKHIRIALFGIFGVQNIGNECTLQAMLYNVRKRLPNAEVYSISYVPEDTLRRHTVPAVPVTCAYSCNAKADAAARRRTKYGRIFRALFRRLPAELSDWYRAYKVMKGTDLLVMTGTGMLTDYSTSALGYPYDIFKWTVAARIAGTKVRFVGIGVGPIYERLSRLLIKSALAIARYRSFRDHFSKTRLQKIGFDTTEDPVFPDLAFSLPSTLFQSRPPDGRPKRIVGLGIMQYVDIHATTECERNAAYETYLNRMCDFATWLLQHGYALRVLQGDMKYDRQVRSDFRTMMGRRLYPYDVYGILDDDVSSVGDLLAQLAEVDVIVSPRFHNLILGLMLNKPVISISYDPKNDALLEGMGLGQYCQSIDRVDVAALIDLFRGLENKAKPIRQLVSERVAKYRRLLECQYTMVLGDL